MKTKTTRLVDPQGRVSIPGYLRELTGINPGGTVTVEVGDDNSLRIYANVDRCCICGETHADDDLLQVSIGPTEHLICPHCARKIINTVMKDMEENK